ncbi:MAG: indolepyruvate ferredoxin oxidoreductase family protein [Xanthobacteraceae bacterium]
MGALLKEISLEDRFTKAHGTVLLTGVQALVRLLMLQHDHDKARGVNTAGFISGYRGSPLGGLDREIVRASKYLDPRNIVFQPGVNEELGAMAVWGSQQVNLYEGGKYDGVFGMWYGKGAGLDRCGDVFRHANAAGSAPNGGVLIAVGDDHLAKSSSQPHNCEVTFTDLQVPLFHPATVSEVIEYGLYAYAMSRYSGLWAAMKLLPEVADSLATVDLDAVQPEIRLPPPAGDVNIRVPDPFLQQETRLVRVKRAAALRFARLNRLDKVALTSPRPQFGVVAAGKSYLDVLEALRLLGVNREAAAAIGLTIYKVAMPTPLEPEGLTEFANGLEEILVVEEKRPVMEQQIKDTLYNLPAGQRPRVVGKLDLDGTILIPRDGDAPPDLIARVLGHRLLALGADADIARRVARLQPRPEIASPAPINRVPFYCPGCPHNLSTKVIDGSRVIAGIGCHSLAQWMDRRTDGLCVMGGEGSPWIGQTPFTEQKHVFTNIGDGTFFHSGLPLIKAAVSAKVNITYKILFNDAVAMTGGQPFDGPLSVPMITHQVAAEGVSAIVIVADDPDKYPRNTNFAPGTVIKHRDMMEKVQERLRDTPGTTVLIYDQVCAAEKRRRRKRGLMADPDKRIVINEAVCEGCGDCSVKSNCIAVEPLQTELGRKRQINQSACNKDFSCTKGFCPSFVEVEGGKLRKAVSAGEVPIVPDIAIPALNGPWRMLIAGIGGTGVVTISALLGTAAHLEGKVCGILDQTGMAQKGGAVASHITIARSQNEVGTLHVTHDSVDVLIGADAVFTSDSDILETLSPGQSVAIINADIAPTGEFVRNANLDFRTPLIRKRILTALGEKNVYFAPAARLATKIVGDTIAANIMLIGFAFQKRLIPISEEAILKAIELNGAAVAMNKTAFAWGRALAHDPASVEKLIAGSDRNVPNSLEERLVQGRSFLAAYQDSAYAGCYAELVEVARSAEARRTPGMHGFAEAVARYAFKLMSYKDEYEVARLYTDGSFERSMKSQFEDGYKIRIQMSPPILARRDPATGELRKMSFGGWILPMLRVLARFRFLRGTNLDPFGHTAERKQERALIKDYFATIKHVAARLSPANHDAAVQLANLPEQIRGFGHVKTKSIEKVQPVREKLLAAIDATEKQPVAAA